MPGCSSSGARQHRHRDASVHEHSAVSTSSVRVAASVKACASCSAWCGTNMLAMPAVGAPSQHDRRRRPRGIHGFCASSGVTSRAVLLCKRSSLAANGATANYLASHRRLHVVAVPQLGRRRMLSRSKSSGARRSRCPKVPRQLGVANGRFDVKACGSDGTLQHAAACSTPCRERLPRSRGAGGGAAARGCNTLRIRVVLFGRRTGQHNGLEGGPCALA